MKKIFALILIAAFGGLFTEQTFAQSTTTNAIVVTPDFLAQLASELQTNSPALRAAAAMSNAALASVAAVRTWEDPMIMAGGMAADQMMREQEGDVIYGVEQMLPLWGKPRAERNVARAQLSVEAANVSYQFQKLRVDLAKAAFRAALADRIVAIGEQDLAWLDTMKELAESTARVGNASLVDVLRIQNERAIRVNQLETDRKQLAHEQVTLNRLLNRETQTHWPRLELPAVAGAVAFNPRLVEFALKYEPKTAKMREEVKMNEAMVEMTSRKRFPDVSAGVEARNYSGDGSWKQAMFTLRMNLPWANHDKIRAEIRRDQANSLRRNPNWWMSN